MIIYRELSSLEQDLGISAKTMYAVSNNLGKHYHTVKLPKKNGGYRELSVPDPLLKSIQKQISCRFVRLKRILDFTRVRSRGTEI